jgi:hypothetical protein
MSLGSSPVWLSNTFEFGCATAVCPPELGDAFARYNALIFFAGTPATLPGGAVAVTGLNITVLAAAPLALHVSENYTLTVPAAGGVATAVADTQWAALRAIETFSQLFAWAGNSVPTAYGCAAAPVAITDFPRWPWRGVLVDSSRHFLTKSALYVTLDAMAMNKLNTMHWHLVDDSSWPMVSTTLPLMSVKGAYAPEATYSHADLEDVVRYANARGIRVVPELDMPAHASIWGAGYPQFTISCADGQTLLNPVPSAGLYDAIDGLLGEFLPIFNTVRAQRLQSSTVRPAQPSTSQCCPPLLPRSNARRTRSTLAATRSRASTAGERMPASRHSWLQRDSRRSTRCATTSRAASSRSLSIIQLTRCSGRRYVERRAVERCACWRLRRT